MKSNSCTTVWTKCSQTSKERAFCFVEQYLLSLCVFPCLPFPLCRSMHCYLSQSSLSSLLKGACGIYRSLRENSSNFPQLKYLICDHVLHFGLFSLERPVCSCNQHWLSTGFSISISDFSFPQAFLFSPESNNVVQVCLEAVDVNYVLM